MPAPDPRLVPLIIEILKGGKSVLTVGRIRLPIPNITQEEDLDRALKRAAKKYQKKDKADRKKALSLYSAIEAVEEAINGGAVLDATTGAIKEFLSLNPDIQKINLGVSIGDAIVRRLRAAVFPQDSARSRVTYTYSKREI